MIALTFAFLRLRLGLIKINCDEIIIKQAGAELCQAQFRLGFAKIASHDVEFPLLKIGVCLPLTNN
jgi:hypothetical protein